MKKRLLSIIALCLALCAVFSACTPAASNSPETTEEKKNIMQTEDPKQDDTFNLLMIGNSFSFYFTEELFGLAKAAGVKMRVANIYSSGCTLEQHWTWWKGNMANYQSFTVIDENGTNKVEGVSLEYCLKQYNWDAISLQEASSCVRTASADMMIATTETYLRDLWTYIKEQFPQSRHLWHQTWSYQIGFDNFGYRVADVKEQKGYADRMKTAATQICQTYGLERINSGEAWEIVRDGGYDNLCARLSVKNGEGDYYHDGDIGGGQYLNACVWFEILTGQSCVGNTYRPNYELSEDMITTLQNAAHQAVANR